jgi:hypothetical protein
VQEVATPSRPEYSEGLNLKGFIQLYQKTCRYDYHLRQSVIHSKKFGVFGVFSGKISKLSQNNCAQWLPPAAMWE